MGKFNEYSQKATPADNDTMMIYDATSKANKLSPFSGIWNWIVNKLTNAVIANLQTDNKTVLGAINELNSNRLREYNWRAYDDIISAINAEKETVLIQGSSVFSAATNGGHPYMIILCVPESRDAVGVYVDYFKPDSATNIVPFRYRNGSFEIIV